MAERSLDEAQWAVVRGVRDVERPGAASNAAVVVGVSGGADSLALAAALAWLVESRVRNQQPPLVVEAVVVDHGLQAGSAEVAESAAARVRGLGLPCRVVRGGVEQTGEGPEGAARTLRRLVLAEAATEMAAGAGLASSEIWLAHTRDDVAEQVLLGLARGSGGRSLAGIPPRHRLSDGLEVVRPLLGVTREQTRRACLGWGLTVWDDPHNTDPRFARSRVRTRVLPVLEQELGPGVAEALVRSADLLREDADLLDDLTTDWLDETRDGADLLVDRLAGRAPARVSRVVRAWLVQCGVAQPSRSQVLAVVDLVDAWRGQRGIDLPGGSVRRVADDVHRGRLVFTGS